MQNQIWQKDYQAPVQAVWQGRSDSLPRERVFQVVECIDLTKQSKLTGGKGKFAIIGFCSDTGIKRNQGRIGAAEGPAALRTQFAKLALINSDISFYDVGDILCHNDDLESAQQSLAAVVAKLISNNIIPIVLGGGHETAWGHFQGIAQAKPKLDLGIVNFDAHFDLRPLPTNKLGTSGTPFRQIAEARHQAKLNFDYLCLGVQRLANTKSLFDVAKELNVEYITAEQIHMREMGANLAYLDHFLAHRDAIYLSICLDVFASDIAPGVSSPQALGLYPWQVLPFLKDLAKSEKIISIDIVELSPPNDINDRTAQLGACLLGELISYRSHT